MNAKKAKTPMTIPAIAPPVIPLEEEGDCGGFVATGKVLVATPIGQAPVPCILWAIHEEPA